MMAQERFCRACYGTLRLVFDMGELHLSGFPLEGEATQKAPLDLCRCAACGLVQLRHTVPADALFKKYWYLSGVNETMRAELADVVGCAIDHYGTGLSGRTVVDVGANDGTLLANYPMKVTKVAYEPAENLHEQLRARCDTLIPSYFDGRLERGSVGILTSIACFYAVDEPIAFVSAVDRVLSGKGIWIVQFQDLCQMLEATAFDDICHEHLFYPSMASVERMLRPFDLHVIEAERRAINGGSLRLVIGRKHRRPSGHVAELRLMEAGCEDTPTLLAFADRAYAVRKQIRQSLAGEGVVDLYGASTKGNTMLQFCDIGPRQIRQAWERSPEKWGRHTITGIPIVNETAGRHDPPDALLVGIWQFRDAVIKREEKYLEAGGRLIFPLPEVEVVGGEDVHESVGARADARAIG